MKRTGLLLLTAVLGISIAGCSRDSNLFKFAHRPGSSSDTKSLLSDAAAALRNKNYSDAIKYYSQVLAKNPNNSEALYGYSAARLNSVLPIGDILSRAIQNNAQAPRPVLSGVIRAAVQPASMLSFLPENLNYILVKDAADAAVESLRRIARGLADGVIPPDDVDVLVNLSVCLVISAAIDVVGYDNNGNLSNEFITITQSYEINVNPPSLTQEQKDILKNRLDNLYDVFTVEVLSYLNTITAKIGATSGSTLENLKQDIIALKDAVDGAKVKVDAL